MCGVPRNVGSATQPRVGVRLHLEHVAGRAGQVAALERVGQRRLRRPARRAPR